MPAEVLADHSSTKDWPDMPNIAQEASCAAVLESAPVQNLARCRTSHYPTALSNAVQWCYLPGAHFVLQCTGSKHRSKSFKDLDAGIKRDVWYEQLEHVQSATHDGTGAVAVQLAL